MNKISMVNVFYHGMQVGKLSAFKNRLTAFQYSAEWISTGFSISPFELPLSDKVYISSWEPFNGMFGVFADSLPDGWGRLNGFFNFVCSFRHV